MSEANSPRRLGVWISDKKSQKLNWNEMRVACTNAGYELVRLDVDRDLEEQGPLHVLLHKLTDILARAHQNDPKAMEIIDKVEEYISHHPKLTVIDPLHKVRILLNRNRYYTILAEEESFKSRGIFTPPFAELTSSDLQHNLQILRSRGVRLPVVVKPSAAHGSKAAHSMMLVLNERGLSQIRPPCVVQTFVAHNAVLYKVYLVHNRYHISDRPSLKNFYECEHTEPIHFYTGDVCKADSQSTLSILDPHDKPHANFKMTLDETRIIHIINVLRKKIGLTLYGFDVVIDNLTGDHAVIDINVYPGYDNYPKFYEHLLAGINAVVERNGDENQNGLINVGESCVRMSIGSD